MVCDVCKERDAAVHLTTIEDNAVHQLHLCEKCAAERGVETPAAAPNTRWASSCTTSSNRSR
jgi:protein arginine kinase activator